MPDSAAHAKRAIDNEQFVVHRLDERIEVDRSWMVAALFYAALHWVEAYFATKGLRGKGHRGRQDMIVADPTLGPAFWANYHTLFDRSQDARYELRVFTAAEVNALQHQELAAIKAHVAPFLPPPPTGS